jgi:hypothetical protein
LWDSDPGQQKPGRELSPLSRAIWTLELALSLHFPADAEFFVDLPVLEWRGRFRSRARNGTFRSSSSPK